MAAVVYDTFDDVVENMVYQASAFAVLGDLIPILQAYRIANAPALSVHMSDSNKNDMLGHLTGCVVGTGTDLNAYPLGYATALFFDLDGHVVP